MSNSVTLWTVAHQAPLSMGFSRQEYWSGLPCLPSGSLPDRGIKPTSLTSPALAGGFFTISVTWKALYLRCTGLNEIWKHLRQPSSPLVQGGLGVGWGGGGGLLFWTKALSLLAAPPFQRRSQRILQDLSGEKGRQEVWMSVLGGIVCKQGVWGPDSL